MSTWTPYSLGKLIEWKLTKDSNPNKPNDLYYSPYSLGKLIEWKQVEPESESVDNVIQFALPTR
jgi:hypothetical protein